MKVLILLISLAGLAFGLTTKEDFLVRHKRWSFFGTDYLNQAIQQAKEKVVEVETELNKKSSEIKTTIKEMEKNIEDTSSLSCSNPICSFSANLTKENTVTTKWTVDWKTSSIELNVFLNGNQIADRRMPVENAEPVCMPFPQSPKIQTCFVAFNLTSTGDEAHGCVKLDLNVAEKTLSSNHINCMTVSKTRKFSFSN